MRKNDDDGCCCCYFPCCGERHQKKTIWMRSDHLDSSGEEREVSWLAGYYHGTEVAYWCESLPLLTEAASCWDAVVAAVVADADTFDVAAEQHGAAAAAAAVVVAAADIGLAVAAGAMSGGGAMTLSWSIADVTAAAAAVA